MCSLVVSPKFREQRGVDKCGFECSLNRHFFASVGRGEGETVVAPSDHIMFLIE
jgi:hypothetical protein